MHNGSVDRVYNNHSLVLQGSPQKKVNLDKSDLQHLGENKMMADGNTNMYGNNQYQ